MWFSTPLTANYSLAVNNLLRFQQRYEIKNQTISIITETETLLFKILASLNIKR